MRADKNVLDPEWQLEEERALFAEELREMEKELDEFDATNRRLERAMIEAATARRIAAASRRRWIPFPLAGRTGQGS